MKTRSLGLVLAPLALVAVAIAGMVVWYTSANPAPSFEITAIVALILTTLAVVTFRSLQQMRDLARGIPLEDEMTLMRRIKAGALAFQFSMYLWLFILLFHTRFPDVELMLGFGILGSGALYGLCWMYLKAAGNGYAHQD